MDDQISRKAAIDALESGKDRRAKGDIGGFYNTIIQNDIDKLRNLPSVQPERKKGKWKLLKDGSAICSECGFTQQCAWDLDNWDNFCHHCGADMRGEQKGQCE